MVNETSGQFEDDTDLILPEVRTRPPFKFTVEFPFFLTIFSSALTGVVTYNLLLFRTCITYLHYNETKCATLHLQNKTEEGKELEAEVEAYTTMLVMCLSMLSGIIPAILLVFLGSWSDKNGRKALITWPLLGQLISSILIVVYSAIPDLTPWWFLVCAIPLPLFGGFTTLSLGTNLLINDITTDENRSFRLALVQGCGFLGVLLGTVSSPFVFDALGYVYIYIVSSLLFGVSYAYAVYFVEETLENATNRVRITEIFDKELIKEMTSVCFKKRPLKIATILFLLIASYFMTMFCVYGVSNIDYLFTRQKFQWLLKDYSIFSAVNTIILMFGLFFGMSFFQRVCRMSDGILLMLSYASSIAQAVIRTLSSKPWQMYLAGATSLLGGLSPPLIQSQVAKVVPSSEVGKMYSLISCVEAISPVFSPMLFNTIYLATLSTFPAAIYTVTAALFGVCLVFVTIAEVILYRTAPTDYLHLEDTHSP